MTVTRWDGLSLRCITVSVISICSSDGQHLLTPVATLYLYGNPIMPCSLTDARGNTSILMVSAKHTTFCVEKAADCTVGSGLTHSRGRHSTDDSHRTRFGLRSVRAAADRRRRTKVRGSQHRLPSLVFRSSGASGQKEQEKSHRSYCLFLPRLLKWIPCRAANSR